MTYTNKQVAESFELWQEYVDPDGLWTQEQFDATPVEKREAMIEDVFGTDSDQAFQMQ